MTGTLTGCTDSVPRIHEDGWGTVVLRTGFGLDRLRGTVRQNAGKRAAKLRRVLERLGPAYVKVAQAVSTRVDLLEPEYLIEIERLQDKVPPFPSVLVRYVI